MRVSYAEALREIQQLGKYARHRGAHHVGMTGTMAAGLAAGSYIYGWQYPSNAPAGSLYLPALLHVHFVCLTTLTAPVLAGRRLACRRGTGGAFTGGTALEVTADVATPDTMGSTDNETMIVGQSANTGALTTSTSGGITFETTSSQRMLLAHCGTAGQDYDELWTFNGMALAPGECLGVVAPQAFDVAGTWQVSFKGWGVAVPG